MNVAASTVYGLRRPEQVVELDVVSDPKEIIVSAYRAFLGATKSLRMRVAKSGTGGAEFYEPLYEIACQIVGPFADRLDGTFCTEGLPPVRKGVKGTAIYLSALLNMTGINRLLLDEKMPAWDDMPIGYRLRPGKTVETKKDMFTAWNLGVFAEGGTIINRCEIGNLGVNNEDGVFLNFGEINVMGWDANGGAYLNFGHTNSLGWEVTDGFFVNYGKTVNTGARAKNGTFIMRRDISAYYFLKDIAMPDKYAYGITMRQLRTNPSLKDLVDELGEAGRALDIPKIEKLAKKVDAKVRREYHPRGNVLYRALHPGKANGRRKR